MKKSAILCTLLFSLLLTACGAPAEEEAIKETSYQVLDADEAEVCVISDQAAVEEMNELINSFTSGKATPQGEEPIKPLYTYILWQETTALAGEDPAAERELLEVMRGCCWKFCLTAWKLWRTLRPNGWRMRMRLGAF